MQVSTGPGPDRVCLAPSQNRLSVIFPGWLSFLEVVVIMASSKASPGPHDRKRDPVTGVPTPRPTCQYFSAASGRKCRYPVGKGGKICNRHRALLEQKARDPSSVSTPSPGPSAAARGAIATRVKRDASKVTRLAEARAAAAQEDALVRPSAKSHHTSTGAFMINEQARDALAKLGTPLSPSARVDPKQVLLDSVNSAWRQRQVWEAMLNAVPQGDWEQLGTPPIPGTNAWSKGARIEVIQKYLAEATKVAARTSKLAIDAGIEERLVKLAEEQSALIADTVRAALQAGIAALVAGGLLPQADLPNALDAALAQAANKLRLLAASGGPNGTGGLGVRGGGEIIEGIAREVEAGDA